MSVIHRLAHANGRRDELPNKELAGELAQTNNIRDIKVIAENLYNDDKKIQHDCIKVLYEIGYLNPKLIAEYTADFIKLLNHRNNRMVWGAMTALSTVAEIATQDIFAHLASIKKVLQTGSVITVDSAIKTLAIIASSHPAYHKKIFPLLLDHLKTCRPKEVPMHAEFISLAVKPQNKTEFNDLLRKRSGILNHTQQKRIKKLLNK